MRFLHWIVLLFPCLAAELVACLAAPLLGLLAGRRGGLPRWLAWFATADNPVFGDRGHDRRWSDLSPSLRAVAWLLRNKAYTFRNEIIGARTSGPVTAAGNPAIGDRPLVEGWCLRLTPEGYWHLYVVRRWGLGFFLRANLGWKLWGGPGHPNFGQYVVTIHPFRRIKAPAANPGSAPPDSRQTAALSPHVAPSPT